MPQTKRKTWPLSNSQGKVATLIRWGGLLLC